MVKKGRDRGPDLDICPGGSEFLVTPLQMTEVFTF